MHQQAFWQLLGPWQHCATFLDLCSSTHPRVVRLGPHLEHTLDCIAGALEGSKLFALLERWCAGTVAVLGCPHAPLSICALPAAHAGHRVIRKHAQTIPGALPQRQSWRDGLCMPFVAIQPQRSQDRSMRHGMAHQCKQHRQPSMEEQGVLSRRWDLQIGSWRDMLEVSCSGLTFSPDGQILSRFMDLDPASSRPSVLKAMPREPLRLLAAFPSLGCMQAELMRHQYEATRASNGVPLVLHTESRESYEEKCLFAYLVHISHIVG